MEKINNSSRRTQSNNVPIAAILSIVAGILMIIEGTSIIFMFGWYQSMFGGEGVFIMDRMMHDGNDDGSIGIGGRTGRWPGMMMTYSGAMLSGLSALSSLSLGAGAVSIVGGYKLFKHPERISELGICSFNCFNRRHS
jgi:hypothetical protein